MDSRILLKNIVTKHLILALLVFQSALVFAQDVTISALTGGVAASPLVAGATNQAIFGIQFDKAGGGTNALNGLIISLTEDPSGRFTNVRLVRSDNNNSFDVADLANPVGTVTVGSSPDQVVITGTITPFGNSSGAETRRFFLVVDVDATVTGATAAVQASLPIANVTLANNAVLGSTLTSTNYSFVDTITPTITFNPTAGAINVAIASSLVISFDEAVRNINDSDIDNANVGSLLTLKLTNAGGADVPFTATINAGDDEITIDPTSNLNPDQVYYLNIAPVEDASNNATAAANITFTTVDTQPPVPTFNPLNGAVGVIETNNIVISFNEAIRRASDDSGLGNTSIDGRITLKLTNAAGADIPFDATINAGDDQVTIDPTSALPGNSVIYIAIAGVEDSNDNLINPDPASITFTTGDTQPPTLTFNPANSATGISVSANLTITFSEPIRNIDNSAISAANLLTLVDFKLTNAGGADVPFTATIDGTNTIVTIDPTSNLTANQLYFLRMNPVEDAVNNATSAQSITFTSENGPTFSGGPFTPSTTCVGDNIVISGNNFGAAVPTVTVNGTSTTAVDIIAHNNTSITFRTLTGMTGSGLTVTVLNNTNGLSNTSVSTVTIKPAIALSLPLSSNPSAPVVGGNYDIDVANTQNNVNYAIRELPGGFGGTSAGTGTTISFGPYNKPADGTFQYEVRATSSGCTQRTYGPLSVIIAALSASAGADKTICVGDSVILGGSPTAAGGTGFYSVSWYRLPSNTFVSSSSNPVLRPTSTTSYRVVVNDSPSNSNDDIVTVTVNTPTSAALLDIDLSPSKPNNTYQKEQTDPVTLTYEVSGSPGTYLGSTHFEGPGVNSDGPIKYFYPNAANVGGNQIDLFYENPQGCITKDSIFVFIRDKNLFISGLDERYCRENTNEMLTVNTPVVIQPYGFTFCFFGPCTDYTFIQGRSYTYAGRTRLQNSIDPNDSISNSSIFTYSGTNITLNTDGLTEGTKQFEIYYNVQLLNYSSTPPGYTIAPVTPFKEIVSVPFDVIDKPVVFEFMRDASCENEPEFILDVLPAGGSFTLNGSASTNTFNPGTVGLPNSNTVVYTYTDPGTTCSNSVQNIITLNRLPIINDIDFQNGCVGDTINFTPVFTNPSNINFKYGWDVDGFDGVETNVPNNIPTPVQRSYNVASNYPIELEVITDAGCTTVRAESLTIGQVPDLTLLWANVCDGDNTRFAIKSDFYKNNLSDVDSIIWNFGDGSVLKVESPVFSDSVIQHLYGSTNYFPSSVTITTDLNCRKKSDVLVYKVAKTGLIGVSDYNEDFNEVAFETQAWKSGGMNSSWDWGTPASTLIIDDSSPGGGKAWVTNLSGVYNINEDSWVHSPCFNLTQIQRPVLSFDFKSLTRDGIDGAVLQYNSKNTTNKESDWKTIGAVGSGNNWYNKIAIAANPGNQNLLQTGWTGLIDSTQWRTATIPLDNVLTAIPPAERDKIRLRFAFASSEFTADAEGFAFDNFKISQRDRLVLLEQFTNSGGLNTASEPNKVANQILNTFIQNSSGEAIKLEYHLGLGGPNEDPIYLDNSADANARAAYYGITSTPFTLIDARYGNFGNIFSEQTLQTAGVTIDTIITRNTPADKLNIEVTFTAQQDLPQNSVLHIAVIEKEISSIAALGTNGETTFKYVVKKLLPDATGTLFSNVVLDGVSNTVNVSWSPQAYDLDSLSIIAFVQNQDTKEIYQARFLETPTYIPPANLITGTEPSLADQIAIYPNPAKDEVNIKLPRSFAQTLPIKMIDAFGREVYNSSFSIGEQTRTLKTSEFAAGVYIIQIKSASGEVVRKKVVIAN